jgi:hypothetical protein
MSLRPGRLNLNLEVYDSKQDCKNLMIIDKSYYIADVETPLLEITLPGYTTSLTFNFQPEKLNIYNSYNFRLSDYADTELLVNLPDGVYTFKYSICGVSKSYKQFEHLRTCQLECRADKAFASLVTNCLEFDERKLKILQKVDVLIRGAKASSNVCLMDRAVQAYQKAEELLDALECIS